MNTMNSDILKLSLAAYQPMITLLIVSRGSGSSPAGVLA